MLERKHYLDTKKKWRILILGLTFYFTFLLGDFLPVLIEARFTRLLCNFSSKVKNVYFSILKNL